MSKIMTRTLLPVLIFLFLILSSCQKEIDTDPGNPPPVPDDLIDSTLLIKSIAWLYDDGADSIVEKYMYDTVNRKITLNWTDSGIDPGDPDYQSEYNNSKAVLSYNNKGLLEKIDYSYHSSYIPREYDFRSTEINYDSENIVEKIGVQYMGGSSSSRTFYNTKLPGGNYMLQWEEYNPAIPDDGTTIRTVKFSQDNKVILNTRETLRVVNNALHKYTWKDSLAYDNAGNVAKVFTYRTNDEDNIVEEYISEEYLGRETKGDQLSNQRKLILNGISNLPFGDNDEMISYAAGIMTFQMEYESAQYSKFPIKAARARLWDGSYQNFQSIAEYDSRDRLTRFTGFYVDLDIVPVEYRINYYK